MKGVSRTTRIWTLLVIDVAFFFVEIIIGYAVGSLALVADSFHMLNDVLSLIVALYAVKLAARHPSSNPRYSYGWQRAEILGALINGVFLLALCFSIFMEAIERFVNVQEISNPKLVVIVGACGLGSNILGLFLFHEHGHSHGHDQGHGGAHGAAHDHDVVAPTADDAANVDADVHPELDNAHSHHRATAPPDDASRRSAAATSSRRTRTSILDASGVPFPSVGANGSPKLPSSATFPRFGKAAGTGAGAGLPSPVSMPLHVSSLVSGVGGGGGGGQARAHPSRRTVSMNAAWRELDEGRTSRARQGSVSSLYGHPAQTRAFVVQAAHEMGYDRGRDGSGGVSASVSASASDAEDDSDSGDDDGLRKWARHARVGSDGATQLSRSVPTEMGRRKGTAGTLGDRLDAEDAVVSEEEESEEGDLARASTGEVLLDIDDVSEDDGDVGGEGEGETEAARALERSCDFDLEAGRSHGHSVTDVDSEAAAAGDGKKKQRRLRFGRSHARSRSRSHSLSHSHGHSHGHAHGHGHGHGHGQGGEGSMNMRGVFLHVLGDALGNVGVIAAGLFIAYTDFKWRFYADPLISFVITCIIFSSALPLVRSASFILLQGVPSTIPIGRVKASIRDIPGVLSIHELHIWQLSESKVVASVHVLVDVSRTSNAEYMRVAGLIRRVLHSYGIHSSTIQPEFVGDVAGLAGLVGVVPEEPEEGGRGDAGALTTTREGNGDGDADGGGGGGGPMGGADGGGGGGGTTQGPAAQAPASGAGSGAQSGTRTPADQVVDVVTNELGRNETACLLRCADDGDCADAACCPVPPLVPVPAEGGASSGNGSSQGQPGSAAGAGAGAGTNGEGGNGNGNGNGNGGGGFFGLSSRSSANAGGRGGR